MKPRNRVSPGEVGRLEPGFRVSTRQPGVDDLDDHVVHEVVTEGLLVTAVDRSAVIPAVSLERQPEGPAEQVSQRLFGLLLTWMQEHKEPVFVVATANDVAALPPEYLHEPKLALGSGADGLDATRVIRREAARHLNPGGLLAVEIGHNRHALEAAFPELAFTWPEIEGGEDTVFLLTREQLKR